MLRDWEALNLPQFRAGGEFEKSLDAIHQLFGVNDNFSYRSKDEECVGIDAGKAWSSKHFEVNRNNQLLWEVHLLIVLIINFHTLFHLLQFHKIVSL